MSVVASGSRGASRIIRPVFIASEVRTQQTTTPPPPPQHLLFTTLEKLATTLGHRAAKRGRKPELSRTGFAIFNAILQWQKQSQRVCHGTDSAATHREGQVSMTATQPPL